jgi:ribosomal protein S14
MFKWILCLFTSHDWKVAGEGLPESASAGREYSKCVRCGEDSRQTWEIEDDSICRMERIELELRRRTKNV